MIPCAKPCSAFNSQTLKNLFPQSGNANGLWRESMTVCWLSMANGIVRDVEPINANEMVW